MGFFGWAKTRSTPLYPGDDVVDWIAYDPYGFGGPDGLRRSCSTRPASRAGPGFYTWATRKAPGKPIMLAEWGFDLDGAAQRSGHPRRRVRHPAEPVPDGEGAGVLERRQRRLRGPARSDECRSARRTRRRTAAWPTTRTSTRRPPPPRRDTALGTSCLTRLGWRPQAAAPDESVRPIRRSMPYPTWWQPSMAVVAPLRSRPDPPAGQSSTTSPTVRSLRTGAHRTDAFSTAHSPRPASPLADRGVVLFACSAGGHLAQLLQLRPWFDQRERMWVTFELPDAVSLLADEDDRVGATTPPPATSRTCCATRWLAWRVHPPAPVRTGRHRRAPPSPCRSSGSASCSASRPCTSRSSTASTPAP